jgi:hypothetical protein
VEVADHLEHDLAEEVLGVGRLPCAQIAEERGRVLDVEGTPGPFLARPGGLESGREVLPLGQLTCINAADGEK